MAAACDGANQGLRELESLRREQDLVVKKINKFHARLSTTPVEVADKFDLWTRLRGFYVQAKALGEREESLLGSTVEKVDALMSPSGPPAHPPHQPQQPPQPHRKKPASSAADPKRKRVNSAAAESPRVASALTAPSPRAPPPPHASIAVGDQVAARVSPEDAQNDEWIVVKVTRIDREGNRFEVVDEEPDDDGESGGRAYKLPTACIIPFPKKLDASAAQHLDFKQGSHVLAVYPGTTALYKASVVGPQPRKKMKLDDCLLLEFDGDEEEGLEGLPQRPVPLHHVVTLPEGHRQWQS